MMLESWWAFASKAMIRMMMLMMVVGMTMMKGAIGINMTIRQEATLNWSCVGGRDVALLTTGCGNKEIVAQILRGDDDEEDEDEDKDDYNRFSGNKEIFARIVGMRKMMLKMRMAMITKMRMTPMMYKPLTRSHLIGLYNML